MASTTNSLPKLDISFQDAARAASARTKEGIVAVFVREASLTSASIKVVVRESDIPTKLGTVNADYIKRAMLGTQYGKPRLVYVVMTDTEETEGHTQMQAGLALLRSVSVDYMALYPDATAEEYTLAIAWVKAQRAAYSTVKLVAANTAADDEGIINYCTDVVTAAGAFTAVQFCSRIAGLFAGLPSSHSGTYAVLPEVSSITESVDPNADIAAGKLILIHDGQKAKIARAVNSLTTLTDTKGIKWTKIKLVEASDLLGYYCRITIEDKYIGKYSNIYDNKLLLVSAIQTYLKLMEADGILVPGSGKADIDLDAQANYLQGIGVDTRTMRDQEIKEHYTDTWVFLTVSCTRADVMEDFNLKINV